MFSLRAFNHPILKQLIEALNLPGSLTISQAKIDDSAIGADKANSGAFTTLSASGTLTAAGLIDASGASAGQVKFPATQNASSDANTLDDYEEGSFTPTLTFTTAGDLSVSYTTQLGSYTKIGRLVIVRFTILTSAFTFTTASGSLAVTTGLSFSPSLAGDFQGACAWAGPTGPAGYTQICAEMTQSDNRVFFRASGLSKTTHRLVATDVPTSSTVSLEGAVAFW